MLQLDDSDGPSITLLVRPESRRGMEALASVQPVPSSRALVTNSPGARTPTSSALYFYYYGMLPASAEHAPGPRSDGGHTTRR